MRRLGAAFVALIFGVLGVLFVVGRSGGDHGALVGTTMSSTVGVLLDELPAPMRDHVAASLIAKPDAFWTARAAQQLRLTTYRLVFREAFYPPGKSSLPLPPEQKWHIALAAKPARRTMQGHDVIAVDYRFTGTLLTDALSPAVSEPKLTRVGGTWDEPFVFPVDPELLFQRTGYACMDEAEFPFPSVDSEEADSFYDQECDVEDELSNVDQCHNTRRVDKSCIDALADRIGSVSTHVTYRRLPWSNAVANANRYGTVTGDAPDLQIYKPDFATSRVTYRYVHPASCEVVESAVAGTGWRRLLQFTTSDENVGNTALRIGAVDYAHTGTPGDLDKHNLFEFSPCHKHYHFKYYGDFTWRGNGRLTNSKKGFCLQSTQRVANRERSPLYNEFAGCAYQGIDAGWVDQYKAGLPSQWLDITGYAPGKGARSFKSNHLGLLCEGTLLNENGDPLAADAPMSWAPTKLHTDDGRAVEAPRCKLNPRWDANNEDVVAEIIPPPGRGFITEPCTRGEIGPLRDCGFTNSPLIGSCEAGTKTTVRFSIPSGAQPHVVRLSEFSRVLNTPIPARYQDAYVPLLPGVADSPSMLANSIVGSAAASITFVCPAARGPREPGGMYSVYSAPVFPEDASAPVGRT